MSYNKLTGNIKHVEIKIKSLRGLLYKWHNNQN